MSGTYFDGAIMAYKDCAVLVATAESLVPPSVFKELLKATREAMEKKAEYVAHQVHVATGGIDH